MPPGGAGPGGWAAFAPALRSRNFRLFWGGQIVSVIGTSVQVVAEGWLIYELTGSTFWLGMVGLLGLLPVLPISLIGGVLIDRMPRRKLILITQTGLMIQAAIFGLLATFGQLQLWQIIALYFVFGALLALDNPARRAFLVDLVEQDDLANAVALNATVFNFSSLIGYAVAGLLIAAVGAGPAMLVNAASYLAPILALLLIRVPDRAAEPAGGGDGPRAPLQQALWEGIQTLLRQPVILGVIVLMGVSGGLAYPVFGMMPAFAQDILGLGAVGLGLLLAGGALGSVVGTVVVARVGRTGRGRTLLIVALILPCLIALFAASRQLWVAWPAVVAVGVALLVVQSLAITLVQVATPDRVRGRVMAIYSLLHAGSDTLGNVAVGSAAVWVGLPFALGLGAGVSILAALGLALALPALRRLE